MLPKAEQGRMVRYRYYGQEINAMIQKVHSDGTTCDLYVFWTQEFSLKVPQQDGVGYCEEPIDGSWGWPPFIAKAAA